MKIKKTLLISLLTIFAFQMMGQEETKLDTVYLLGRRKLVVEIKNISSATVRYSDPKTNESFVLQRKQIQKVVFIHGVGEGVLKSELHFLFKKYSIQSYDASYQKYGQGATEVYINQNTK